MSNHVSHGALPYPIKNARYSVQVTFRVAAGTPTDPTTPDTEFSIDGGASFTDCAEEITTGSGNGVGYLTLTGAETNNSLLVLACKSANCLTTPVLINPRVLALVASGTLSAGSSTGGTLGTALGYDVTGCFIRSTGGTGGGGTGGANNQARKIVTYDPNTAIFTVSPSFEVALDNTTTYDILLPEDVTIGMLQTVNPVTPGNKLVIDGGRADSDLKYLNGNSTGATNMDRVYRTDHSINYDSTAKGWLVKLGNYAQGGSATTLELGSSSGTPALLISNFSTGNAIEIATDTGSCLSMTAGDGFGINITSNTVGMRITGSDFHAVQLLGNVLFNGTVTATDASNDIRGVVLKSTQTFNNTGTWTGNLTGKVLGGGVTPITGVGAWVLDGSGNAVAPASTALSSATWTNLRATFLDNLNVGGAVASQNDITALNQSAARRVVVVTSPQYEIPPSGNSVFGITLQTYSADGIPVNADSDPSITATGTVSGNLTGNLSAITNPATGVYRWNYTVSSSANIEQVRFSLSATIAAETIAIETYALVVDTVTLAWTATDAANLTAIAAKLPSKPFLAGTGNSDGDIEMNDATGNFPGTVLDVVNPVEVSAASIADIQDDIITHGDANWTTATGFSVAGDAMALTVAERGAVADKILIRNANGGSDTTGSGNTVNNRSVGYFIRGGISKNETLLDGTFVIYDTDDSTILCSADTTAGVGSISGMEPQ